MDHGNDATPCLPRRKKVLRRMQAEALPTRSVRRDSGLVQTAFLETDRPLSKATWQYRRLI